MESGAFEGRRDAGAARKIHRLAAAHRCNQRVRGIVRVDHEIGDCRPGKTTFDGDQKSGAAWIDQGHQRLGDTGMISKPVHDLARRRLQVVAGQEKLSECQPGPNPGPTVVACRQLRNRTSRPVHALDPQSPTLRRRPAALAVAATERTRLWAHAWAHARHPLGAHVLLRAASCARRATFSAITFCVSSV